MLAARLRSLTASGPVGHMDFARACTGALLGIALTAYISHRWLHGDEGLPFLVGPIGASAVLLFAVPASPLARPWAVMGGNTLSALAGVATHRVVGDVALASGVAVALAIAVMRLTRCLHPPGGATALTAVLGGSAVEAAGWSFVLVPVALNCAVLLTIWWLVGLVLGRHHGARPAAGAPSPHGTSDPPPQERIGYTRDDIDQVLARYDELLDVRAEDLDELFHRVEGRAASRLHGELRCDRIMSTDVVTAEVGERVGSVRTRSLERSLTLLPVLDADGRVVGVVDHLQLLAGARVDVAEVMNRAPWLVGVETGVDELLPVLSTGAHHAAIVVDGQRRLLGLVTQTDLLAGLWRSEVARTVT